MTYKLAGYADKRSDALMNDLIENNEFLRENYQAAAAALLALRAEDKGWAPLNRIEESDGFSLTALKEIAELAELQTTGNPLLKRGFTLKRDNVFGRGMGKEGTIPPRFKAIFERPFNHKTLFSDEAFHNNSRALFTCGNLFMAYEISTKTFFAIPFDEITHSASNPKIRGDVWYYQRSFTEYDQDGKAKTDPTIEWYPTLERYESRGEPKMSLSKSIANNRVNADIIVIDVKVNTHVGGIWGVPDVLPAMPYAWAHSEYIRDAAKLLKALSTIAWKVTTKGKSTAEKAGARMADPKRAGSTATMTENTDITAMPRSGQVDMSDGQAIASYVASALEVSLIALLSDPGSASGSYGAAATLDGPTANSARTRQNVWSDFYNRCFRAVGIERDKVKANFPKIQEDPIYRSAQTLQIGFASGAIHQDEWRASFLELTDVKSLHTEVPEPTVFTTAAQFSIEAAQKANTEAKAQQDAAAAAGAAAGNVQGVGRSNSAGAVSAGNNDNRNQSATPGTGA